MGWNEWIRGPEVEPSLYSANFGRLGEQVDELLPPEVLIQVEGGVGAADIARLRDEGAFLFVAASSVFGDADPPAAYRRLARMVQ